MTNTFITHIKQKYNRNLTDPKLKNDNTTMTESQKYI